MIKGINLTPKSKDEKNVFIITIIGDSNDGDYMTETSAFNEKTFVANIPTIELIEKEIVDWGDCRTDSYELTDEQYDFLSSIIPYSEYDVHDIGITSIEYIDNNGVIYDVSYNLDEIKKENPELFL